MYLVFDTETVGLPRNWDAPPSDVDNWPRMVQIAWFLLDKRDRVLESESRIIRPDGFEIPAEASRIHGITTEDALSRGWALDDVLRLFYSAVQQARVIVAHNMKFDGSVVGAEFLRAGYAWPFGGKRQICTMIESTDYCGLPGRYGNKWPTLDELHYTLFGEGFGDAHDAGADAAACARCFVGLKQRGVVPRR